MAGSGVDGTEVILHIHSTQSQSDDVVDFVGSALAANVAEVAMPLEDATTSGLAS